MMLSDLLPCLSETAQRLEREDRSDLANALNSLVNKLSPYGHYSVEDLPLKAPRTPKAPAAAKKTAAKTPALNDAEALDKLRQLFDGDSAGTSLDEIRVEVSKIAARVPLPSLRKVGKIFLHLPMAKRGKQEIEELLYSHIARRAERASW